jgi:ADP-heptose:LPS heptosyltransferase
VDDAQLHVHAVDRYWRVIEALGAGHLPKQFVLPRSPAAEAWAERLLNPLPRPWLAMNIGTRWETKRWPVTHFIELARRARNRFCGTILLVGSGEEAILGRQVAASLPPVVVDLHGATSLAALVSILARVDAMVSNDSGPLHLAAALGRPVVAPFTCTSPLRTGPYGQLHQAVPTNVWCAASYLKSCRRMDCMRELTPDRLWPALECVLTTWQRRSA